VDAQEAQPPAQSVEPIELRICDALFDLGEAATPQGITGPWPQYALSTADGFVGVEGGLTMTLADESITFNFDDSARVERSYAVLEQNNQRYSLEIRDDRSARTLVDIELVPCGLLVESKGTCDSFCENLDEELGPPTEEEIRHMARRLTDSGTFATEERAIEAIRETIERGPPPPIFDEKALFIADVQ
jgi:hypothetical protein